MLKEINTEPVIMMMALLLLTMMMMIKLVQAGPKSKPLPNCQKICSIVLKSANKIRFLRQIKEVIKHYNTIGWY